MDVRLSLFGPPLALIGERTVALACERRTQLLVYLALRRGWVARAELAALLWPDQPSRLAYTNLRKALFRLQSLEWSEGRLEAESGALRLIVDTDVEAFEVAVREGRAAEAIGLYGGDLLAGFDDDNDAWTGWLSFERGRLRRAWQGALEQSLADTTDAVAGVRLAEQWLATDPLDERAANACMQWLAAAGQPARAQQVYDDFAARLRAELELDPGAELVALRTSLAKRKEAVAASPAARAGAMADDGFIGRAVEMRRVAALMTQADCRLLCITGPGGVGKTRLAQHALRHLQPERPQDAVLVLLEDLAAGNELGGRLARELKVPLKGNVPALEQVVEALRGRELLLALDNFEHVMEAAPALETLLTGCPRLRIIVTSRVRLGLAMEWLLPLDGLPCPEEEDRDRVESFDAARLFVRAVRRVNPAFSPGPEAAAIVDICRQVQGLPLALELAASWTRVLPCEAIAAELNQGIGLLRASGESRPARHAGIDAVFEQSWRLLGDVERAALARLSVFHGGFSPEAARTVASAALPVLYSLADKSLLAREGARLHLHPLVQQLAAARLDDAAAAQAHAAHAIHFLNLLLQLAPAIQSAEGATLRLMDREFENMRRAWQWSVSSTKVGMLGQSAVPLLDYCDFRGRFQEGLKLLQQALRSPAVQADAPLHARLLSKAAHLEYRLDRYADAEASASRALAASQRSADRLTRTQALNVLGTCAFRLGRLDEAQRHFQRVLTGLPGDEPRWRAGALAHLALIEKAQDRYDEALRLTLQSLELYQQLNARADVALCLTNLGALYIVMKNDAAALAHLRESLALCERDGLAGTQAFALAHLVDVATRACDWTAADEYARRAVDIVATTGNRVVLCWVRIMQARIRLRSGNVSAARAALCEALRIAIELRMPLLMFGGLQFFAEILAAQGAVPLARAVLEYVAAHPEASQASRRDAREDLAALPVDSATAVMRPTMGLEEFMHRIVLETDIAYAPLTAQLSGTAPARTAATAPISG